MVKHIETVDVGSENTAAPKEAEELVSNEDSKEIETTNIIYIYEEEKKENLQPDKVEEEPKKELKSKTQRKKWSVRSVKDI